MSLPNWLTYLIPPLVGSVIGLFTNWLAIKMLFRPLAERRVLGLRVPFTPGILPRERERISRSLGDTVAVDLLDQSTVTARLSSPAFRETLRKAALGVGRDLLASTPASLGSGADPALVTLARDAAIGSLAAVASSETFARSVDAGVEAGLEAVSGVSLAELLPRSAFDAAAGALTDPVNAGRIGAAASGAVLGALRAAAAEGKSAADVLDAEAAAGFARRIAERAYPRIVGEVQGLFADRNVASLMEKAGAKVIRRALDRFSAVQRFFIGLGQYDKAILDNMPATIADFSEAVTAILSEPSTRAAVADRAGRAVAALLERPLSELPFLASDEAFDTAAASLSAAFSSALSGLRAEEVSAAAYRLAAGATVGDVAGSLPSLERRLGAALARWAAGLLGGSAETEGSFGDAYPSGGIAGVSAPGEAASFPSLGPARPEPTAQAAAAFLAAFAGAFKAEAADVPLGRTVALDEAGLETIADAAARALSSIAVAESPAILESIDIRSLVIEKIDSLDMIQMERMILKVVDKELGAITMFGGILGALIGAFQTLFFLIR